jgi:toxin YoeB
MDVSFSKIAWEDYFNWQYENKKLTLKINKLIKEIQRNPFEVMGKPEAFEFK